MNGIAFNMSQHFEHIKAGKPFDICYTIEENTPQQWFDTVIYQRYAPLGILFDINITGGRFLVNLSPTVYHLHFKK